MANPWRGEVTLVIDGEARVLKLTLGALAELEEALDEGSLVDLVERFEGGRFSGRDVLKLIVAGLRGGGWNVVAGIWCTRILRAGLWGPLGRLLNCWRARFLFPRSKVRECDQLASVIGRGIARAGAETG